MMTALLLVLYGARWPHHSKGDLGPIARAPQRTIGTAATLIAPWWRSVLAVALVLAVWGAAGSRGGALVHRLNARD